MNNTILLVTANENLPPGMQITDSIVAYQATAVPSAYVAACSQDKIVHFVSYVLATFAAVMKNVIRFVIKKSRGLVCKDILRKNAPTTGPPLGSIHISIEIGTPCIFSAMGYCCMEI